jgi:hypothetical protein
LRGMDSRMLVRFAYEVFGTTIRIDEQGEGWMHFAIQLINPYSPFWLLLVCSRYKSNYAARPITGLL